MREASDTGPDDETWDGAATHDVEAAKVLADAAVKIALIRWLLAPLTFSVCAIALMAAAAVLHVPVPRL